MADGRSLIYKAQAEPTVEPQFYARARSPLLVAVQAVERHGGPDALLLEEIAAPRLGDLCPGEKEALSIGRAVLSQIAEIQGLLPAMADIRTEERWLAYAAEQYGDLNALVDSGAFRRVDGALAERLARLSASPGVLAALRGRSGYVHFDLAGDNLFVLAHSYRLIDWQRPIWGPVELDLASLLDSLGMEPRAHLSAGLVQLYYLLRISWLAQCARRHFPQGAATYDAQIVELASLAAR